MQQSNKCTLHAQKLYSTNGSTSCTYADPTALVDANPARISRPLFAHKVELIRASEWTSEPGAWKFERPTDTVEIFHIITGQCRLVAEDDESVTFGPGDVGMLPAGFKGTFVVVEAVRKIALIVPPTDEY